MKNLVFIFAFFLSFTSASAQGWQWIGPDTTMGQIQKLEWIRGNKDGLVAITSEGLIKHVSSARWTFLLRNKPWIPPNQFDYVHWIRQGQFDSRKVFLGTSGGDFDFEPRLVVCSTDSIDWGPVFWRGIPWPNYYAMAFENAPGRNIYANLHGICRSVDSGITWTRLAVPVRTYQVDEMSVDSQSRFLYYVYPSQLYSYDLQKHNEQFLFMSPIAGPINKYSFVCEDEILVFGVPPIFVNGGGLFLSKDRGTSWERVIESSIGALYRSQWHGPIFAGSFGVIYMSTDRGLTWRVFNNTLPSSLIISMVQIGDSDTLAVATRSGVYKVYRSVVTPVEHSNLILPRSTSLVGIFPNPFNPGTTIVFNLSRRSHISLNVIDLLGREVAVLYDGVKEMGGHTITFDASRFATGIYFCRLSADGVVQTRKMIFQK